MTEIEKIMPIAQPTPMVLLQRAMSSNASVEVLEKLMALQERYEANQARKAFDAAIAEAKAEIKPILKTRTGHNSKYEDLADIAAHVDPILAKVGLSYRYRSTQNAKLITVTCIVSHKGGHSEETSLSADPDNSGGKAPIHAVGSTLTYLQRYSLKLGLGLAAARDDDGSAAANGSSVITSEQLTELQDLIKEVGAQTEKVCKLYHVETLEELTTKKFEDAKVKLRKAHEEYLAKVKADAEKDEKGRAF